MPWTRGRHPLETLADMRGISTEERPGVAATLRGPGGGTARPQYSATTGELTEAMLLVASRRLADSLPSRF
jgi:hypothetical protein